MGCPVSLLLALAAAAETHASSQGLAAIERRLDEQASELAALRARVATLEAETAATAKTSVVLSPLGGSQQGVEGAQAARRLSHATPQTSCCRWTASDTCTTVTRQCTELHEYLESKTTTHEFFDVEHANCLGPDSSSTWSWAYDGHKGNVTLSSDGSAVTAFKTPLRVTHAQDCSTVLPTLTLQLDTQVDGALSVAGALSAPNGLTSATSSVILHPGGLDDLYLYFCYSLDCFSSGSTGSKWSTGPRFSADSTDWTPMTWSSGFNTGDMPGLRSVWELTIGGAGSYASYASTYHITMLLANSDPVITPVSGASYNNNVILLNGACSLYPNCVASTHASFWFNVDSQLADVGSHHVQVTMRKISDFPEGP